MANFNITNVTINNDGWSAYVTLQGQAGEQGNITYDFGTPGSTDTSNFYFTVTSEGYNSSGVLGTVTRTVYATKVVRKPYPDNANLDEVDNLLNLRVRVALSEYVYNDDKDGGAGTAGTNPTVTVAAGFATNGGDQSNAYSNSSVTNNSTLDYPKAVGQWVQDLGSYRRLTSNFQLGFNARHRLGIAAVRFTTDDENSNQDDRYVTSETAHLYARTGYYGSYYITPSITLSTFNDGDTLTSRVRVYPTVGDADSVLDTNAESGTDEAYQRSNITNVCDISNTPVIAYVSSSGVTAGTSSTTESVAQAAPFNTVANAFAATPTPDIEKLDGSGAFEFEYTGSALSDTGYFREIQLATDATATLTKTSANRSIANLKRIKFSSVDFSSFTSWIDGASAATSYLWFDDVEFTVGSITTFVAYRSQFARLTNCSISGTDADVYKQFSTARAVMLLEGHSDTSTAVDNNQMNCVFRMVGCEMRQGWVGIHASSPVGSEDRCMYENNKIQINRDSKGFQSNGQIENGLVFAGNILGRRNGAEGSNTLLQIAADSHTLTADNCLVCHNTVLGQRSNVLYDDFTGRTGSCDHQKFVGNLFTFHNQKSDAFNHPTQGQSGDRVSNWAALHGVGYLDNRWDADSGGFRQEYGR